MKGVKYTSVPTHIYTDNHIDLFLSVYMQDPSKLAFPQSISNLSKFWQKVKHILNQFERDLFWLKNFLFSGTRAAIKEGDSFEISHNKVDIVMYH